MRRHLLFPDRVLADAERFLFEAAPVVDTRLDRKRRKALTFIYLVLGALGLLAVFVQLARAGGPGYVAGTTYFNQGLAGTPLTWAQGAVTYYTDQGDLSGILPGPSADALVADAFSQWTSVPTAAVVATHGGQLAENVDGSNVYRNSDGSITMPADIEPSAVDRPVGVVYDEDGTVTDALLGQGAGDPSQCFENAAYGGIDNFGVNAQILHALVVLNGNCAQSSSQLTDVEYRLVRVLGTVLGLGWSQANLNVITGNPPPTQDDYAGFPVMHNIDPLNCVPITLCYPNPYQPKVDDQAALSRLYPAPGFSANTARVYGSVYFNGASGQAGQAMQGVNVVARWINPSTGLPSGAYVATSVSGFLFSGNAGNTVTGFYDPNGNLFTNWGSADTRLEGFFDLAGLQIPNGQNNAQFQLSVEAVDPMWSVDVGPYAGFQVEPSGSFPPVVLNVSLGDNLEQDLQMQNSSVQTANWFGPTSFGAPVAVPAPGDWAGALSPYGDLDYFWFSGQANRTMSVLVTALDENGNASESKAEPVIGMWALADQQNSPAPANTPSAFNSSTFGMSLLNAQLLQTTNFRIGISDYRGDGRPDYRYHARVFYGDHVNPPRASVAGGTGVAIVGLGFQQNTQTQVVGEASPVLAATATQLLLSAPSAADGPQDVSLVDPPTNASSVMSGALMYGAGPTDTLKLVAGSNPGTPVGGQAPNPIVVQVVQSDGVTPVNGASVFLTSTPALAFSACSGAGSCTVTSDGSGLVSTLATVLTSGVMTITAQLAPASYSSPQQVQTTLLGTSSSLDLSLLAPYQWIAQGASVNLTLTARVLSNGVPLNGKTVNFYLTRGSGTLNPPSANTNGNGYVSSVLQISVMTGSVQVSVCVEPGDNPCQTFYGTAVPGSALQLHPVSGEVQFTGPGTSFQPISVRVTDSANPPDPVEDAPVMFQAIIGRTGGDAPIIPEGDGSFGPYPLPIILGSWQVPAASDANGLVSIQPSTGGFVGDLAVEGSASAGTSTLPFLLQAFGEGGN
jgi:IPT/TIG domain-containing protein